MGIAVSKTKLTDSETKLYLDNKLIFANVAIRYGYHPAGYDMFNPVITKENDGYYMTWKHLNSCD